MPAANLNVLFTIDSLESSITQELSAFSNRPGEYGIDLNIFLSFLLYQTFYRYVKLAAG
jgi:hypothetical protein